MGKFERDKGLRGELEVKNAFEAAGFEIRSLEGEGDNLVVFGGGVFVMHVETKRQEKLRIELWSKQAEDEAPPGVLPIVAYRRARQPWRVSMTLDSLLQILQKLPK